MTTSTGTKITVFVLGQHVLLRQGIVRSLAAARDIEVLGTADLNDDVLPTIGTLAPSVALVEVEHANNGGLTLVRKMKQESPDVGAVLISSESVDADLVRTLAGQGILLLGEEVTADRLIDTVRSVAHGERPNYASLMAGTRAAVRTSRQPEDLGWPDEGSGLVSQLTPREADVLKHIARGCLNKQIAIEFGLSEQTIKNHVTSIFRKLNASARTEAVVIGIRQGLISIN